MIRLRFNSLSGTDPAILGPAPLFRIEGPLLQQGADHIVVGRYFDHHWELGGRFVSSYECIEPARLQFLGVDGRSSETFGPFQQVRFPNGSCYADRTLFAEYVDAPGAAGQRAEDLLGRHGQWVHRATLTRWPVLVMLPATEVRPR